MPDPSGFSYYPQPNFNNQAPGPLAPDFSYMYNMQQNTIAQQQSNISQTIAITQSRMQDALSATLQGSLMAASALSVGAHRASETFHERLYKDVLLGNGNYALERSVGRDLAFATGIAGSGFGQALKIGGRKPEWLSREEYSYQVGRSVNRRFEEFGDAAISGVAGLGGALMSTGVGFLPGLAIQASVGFAAEGLNQRRQYSRENREFAQVTDFNRGTGQRRMSEEGAAELSSRFMSHDLNIMQALPLIGDRFKPDTLYSDTFKKMGSMGLLRGTDVNDINEIEKQVKETTKFIERFAGLAKITKDESLKLMATFKEMGQSNSQVNGNMNTILKTSYATGIDVNTLANTSMQFTQMGFNAGFGLNGLSGQTGLNQIRQISALREAGVISRMFDPTQVAIERFNIAGQFSNTAAGQVLGMNNGTLSGALGGFRGIGGGDAALGYAIQNYTNFEKDTNPQVAMDKAIQNMYDRFSGPMGNKKALASLSTYFGRRYGKEAGAEVIQLLGGIKELGEDFGNVSAYTARANQIGMGDSLVGFNVDSYLASRDNNFTSYKSSAYVQGKANALANTLDDIKMNSRKLTKDDGDLYYNNKSFGNDDIVKAVIQKKLDILNGNSKFDQNKLDAYDKLLKTYARGDQAGFSQLANSELLKEDKFYYNSPTTGFANSDKEAAMFIANAMKKNNSKGELEKRFEAEKLFGGDVSGFMSDFNRSAQVLDVTSSFIERIKSRKKGFNARGAIDIADMVAGKGGWDKITNQDLRDLLGDSILESNVYGEGYAFEAKRALQTVIANDKGYNSAERRAREGMDRYILQTYEKNKSGNETIDKYRTRIDSDVVTLKNLGSRLTKLKTGEDSEFLKAASDIYGSDISQKMSRIIGTGNAQGLQKMFEGNFSIADFNDERIKNAINGMSDDADADLNRQTLQSLNAACTGIANHLGVKIEIPTKDSGKPQTSPQATK